ncbi:hypothetical protein MNBD_ALPHA03-498 [hydrothermal vent metagenome]|uniref:Uncharacterized protein n=1 Tax=hydrothermal vent metagenome TaxID=652676 RepID=A0A3B1B809_9ZZZZ
MVKSSSSSDEKEFLSSSENPYRNKTYVVSITQEITLNQKTYLFGLRYIPDKLILDHDGLADYLRQMLAHKTTKAEKLGHDILEDVTNHIIPKWIEVNLVDEENNQGQNIWVTIEGRQPNWENDALLKRLPAIF